MGKRKKRTVALALFDQLFPVLHYYYCNNIYRNVAVATQGITTYGTRQKRFESEKPAKESERLARGSGRPVRGFEILGDQIEGQEECQRVCDAR